MGEVSKTATNKTKPNTKTKTKTRTPVKVVGVWGADEMWTLRTIINRSIAMWEQEAKSLVPLGSSPAPRELLVLRKFEKALKRVAFLMAHQKQIEGSIPNDL